MTTDDQSQAEALDTDKLPGEREGEAPTDDPAGDLRYPADRLMGANAYGVTAGEERTDEPLDERMSREEPELLRESLEGHPPPVWDERVEPVGRLVEPGTDDDVESPDEEPDAVASAFDATDLAPEEAAVHVTDDPPLGAPGDGYI